jgi:myo-inositol 2-dehydrogenase/D-chiro-inositol 1-dehydrogenase
VDELHIGLVGVGRIGGMHARTLRALDDVTRLTVADADVDRARAVDNELDADAAATPDDLLAAGIDALVIAAPTAAHAPLLRLAVQVEAFSTCRRSTA